MDLVAVRAELKAWEKSFKAQNGRNPSKDDIKAHPDIAQKYKLYSKTRVDAPSGAAGSAPPSVASEKKRPPPAIAPVTPSKPGPSHFSKDVFKTPTSSAAKRAKAPTEFAFAPSPSRLRALAASKSFSGSPNKSNKTRDYNFADEPLNLGRSAVVAADTPRTKAAKWLQGHDVSPPKKISKMSQSAQAPQAAIGDASTDVSKNIVSGNSAGFWTEMEKLKREDTSLVDEYMAHDVKNGLGHNEDDDDVLAPSPVKPIKAGVKVNKGKQRDIAGMFDLLGAGESTQESKAGSRPADGHTISSTRNGSAARRESDPFASTSASFFSSANPLPARMSRSRSPSSGPAASNGKAAKTKKRTSTLAALQPFDALADDSEEENEEKMRLKVEKAKEEAILSALQEEEDGDAPKPKSKPSRNSKRLRSEAHIPNFVDQDVENLDMDGHEARGLDQPMNEEAMPDEDEYETRDLSDEYESYSSRKAVQDGSTEIIGDDNALDASIDPNLVSLLSLRTSPIKNRLSRLHKKRDETVSKLLLEPTYLMKEKKEKERKGLEDLSDEEPTGETLQSSDNERNDGELAAASDDDWASEPEGWKDLGDGEMDGLDW